MIEYIEDIPIFISSISKEFRHSEKDTFWGFGSTKVQGTSLLSKGKQLAVSREVFGPNAPKDTSTAQKTLETRSGLLILTSLVETHFWHVSRVSVRVMRFRTRFCMWIRFLRTEHVASYVCFGPLLSEPDSRLLDRLHARRLYAVKEKPHTRWAQFLLGIAPMLHGANWRLEPDS